MEHCFSEDAVETASLVETNDNMLLSYELRSSIVWLLSTEGCCYC